MKILMVCLGNICRSPMAEGILRHLAHQRGIDLIVDSAGTADYHVGEAPDARARAAMMRRSISIEDLRGRQVALQDFTYFDMVLAMDNNNLRDFLRLAPNDEGRRKVELMLTLASTMGMREVPDPYYGPDSGFDDTYHLLENACNGLLDAIAHR
ncbi:MAG: low molecular weight phosphotyrosine protein phosphatase [Flavobacteriales bacterium]|nr:low molecular weight phosphotyrosine protein phosphatase [Flavobacteriales bacterium]